MKLTYQTGIAALIQLGVMTALNILNGLVSSVQQCTNNSGDCVSNIIVSMLYFMVLTIWIAAVWICASAAQTQRSRKLALTLMLAEFLIFAVATFDAKHNMHNSVLGFITSIIDAVLAVWVFLLASRIFIHGAARVTRKRTVKKQA